MSFAHPGASLLLGEPRSRAEGEREHVERWCPPTSEPVGQDTCCVAQALGALMNRLWEIPFLSPALCGVSQLLPLLSPLLGSQGIVAQGAGCSGWAPKTCASTGGSQGRMPGLPRTAFPVSNRCLSPNHMRLLLLVLGWPLPGVIPDQAPSPPAPLPQTCISQEQ